MYRLKNKLHTLFALRGWRIFQVFTAIAIIAVVAVIFVPSLTPRVQRLYWRARLHTLNRQHFLYDFDYMMRVLEENFPYFDLVERTRDIDMRLLAAEVREKLADPSTGIRNAYDFYYFLRANFFGVIGQVGHLQLMSARRWHSDMFGMTSPYTWYFWGDFWYELAHIYLRPQSVAFYQNFPGDTSPLSPGEMVEVEIIEEGRIGLIRINHLQVYDIYSQYAFQGRYAARVSAFLRYTANFRHMIIDIRGNGGGRPWFFMNRIAPYISRRPLWMHQYIFINDTQRNSPIISAEIARRRGDPGFSGVHFGRISESARENMPEYLHDFDQALSITTTVVPRLNRVPAPRPIDRVYTGTFRGQVWMLVDGGTASAAEQVAWISYYTNFATLVGEPTMGIPASINIHMTNRMSLPHTGMILRYDFGYAIDSQGRYFEGRGIQPDYLNRPGFDAMETVLQLIEEGD